MSQINGVHTMTHKELDQKYSEAVAGTLERLHKATEKVAELGEKVCIRDEALISLIDAAQTVLALAGDTAINRANLRIAIDTARKVIE